MWLMWHLTTQFAYVSPLQCTQLMIMYCSETACIPYEKTRASRLENIQFLKKQSWSFRSPTRFLRPWGGYREHTSIHYIRGGLAVRASCRTRSSQPWANDTSLMSHNCGKVILLRVKKTVYLFCWFSLTYHFFSCIVFFFFFKKCFTSKTLRPESWIQM